MIGYSQQLVKANKKANKKLLGVQLGMHCISRGISVIQVSEHFGVSRTAVYAWFKGESEVSESQHDKLVKFVKATA